MLTKKELEKYLKKCLTTGADFAEIFLEESQHHTIKFNDQKVQKVEASHLKGIGIRICKDEEIVYGYTSHLEKINELIERLILNFSSKPKFQEIKLNRKKKYRDEVKIPHAKYPIVQKKEIFYQINKYARNFSDKVNQVQIGIVEQNQKVTIANSDGLYKEDNRILTRLSIMTFVKEKEKQEKAYIAPGFKMGYEFLEKINLQEMTEEVVNYALEKLEALECPSGEMPVIIGNGFGGVIFHEACVHALEATTVAKGTSVFSRMLNQQIASPKVTIIDDGTIHKEWGSFNIDDEGAESKKNILIENGILTSYLIDYQNSKIMKEKPTSSGRRQSYQFAPTSRMSNTYLAPGNDKIEDMIASIKYGIYAKNLGGGSVDPKTGDFNFVANEAYLIENGKVTHPVKGASLIGNGKEIIKRVSMVSDDLELSTGLCGSNSGSIPVTVGQPTIKVDKILVGGKGEKYQG